MINELAISMRKKFYTDLAQRLEYSLALQAVYALMHKRHYWHCQRALKLLREASRAVRK
jgi:hypothetical protein